MYSIEFTLGPQFRRHILAHAIVYGVVAFLLLFLGVADRVGFAVGLGGFFLVIALCCAANWAGHRRLSTLITPAGITVYGHLRTSLVPWSEVREIQTNDALRVGTAGRRRRTNNGGARKVAYVKVVRTSGRDVTLPAPLVTRAVSDPQFDDKVRTIKAAWQDSRAGSGQTRQPDRAG
ncbi:MAG TPA: PH domain-containing protein [Actinocrinis sp.]|nr:PH domain-containing protein [Actinocrinis sp.]